MRPMHACSALFLAAAVAATIATQRTAPAQSAAAPATDAVNLALYATPTTSFVSGNETLEAINDGFTPRSSRDHNHGAYGNWPRTGTQWVQYAWPEPIATKSAAVYWWQDGQGIHLPAAARLLYWDGSAFQPVPDADKGAVALTPNTFNTVTFDEIKTTRLRLEIDADGRNSTGILEWRVLDDGNSPKFAPRVAAGEERTVVLPGKTYLTGSTRGSAESIGWSKASGPGDVSFDDPAALATAASFSLPGEYVLQLTARAGDTQSSDQLHVHVQPALQMSRLDPVYPSNYAISSPMWLARMKPLITHWIPHCIDEINDPNLKEGGIDNLVQAGNKLAGKPWKPHVGYPFANAWVFNTLESMCDALMVDAQGDTDILAAQDKMRQTVDSWIPIILAAQEPDGYFQTRFTLGTPRENGLAPAHWTVKTEHEGYVTGYFLEAAIADYEMTKGHDRRLYDAAKRLADCWANNLGPGKKAWYDGHEEVEQALVRFGRFVNDVEAPGAATGPGDKYVALAKFLLDCRGNNPAEGRGDSYDQSQSPVTHQYEALGHAVRAAYLFSGMADVAAQTRDPDYQSAVYSLWDDMTNKKWYVTGGIGSGDTSEGFGKDYALRNNSYCESCSNCGALFFQWKMNLAYHDAKFADLYEKTLYNAILGDFDLSGDNFTYTNPLDTAQGRYAWHNCPCCVGNFPRTLLMLPTWMYSKGTDGIYTNLYVGTTVNVPAVTLQSGQKTDVQMVQETNYPYDGKVMITVNPETPGRFALHLRSPHRTASELYSELGGPDGIDGITTLKVNGQPVEQHLDHGYAVIDRQWNPGDKVELDLPLKPFRIKAIDQVAADRDRVALAFGPLVYNIESVDQKVNGTLPDNAPLAAEWKPDLLGGTMAITGAFADNSPLLAVPNYLRENRRPQRGVQSLVWIRDR
ncbi:MAG TPA: beta-L-arabinofuranosidase domain-containing protein [Phycisphaerae bacterium]|nr:beta-L-arabinofuranosidase domain-containing protein [Phycisphaerae bacterium]